jgi:uncharacterized protein
MTGRRIAVVGGGVSGITAGYVLAQADHGGHADTHPTGVDTGFIVYNERTYPLLAEVPRFHRAARRVLDHGDPDGQVLADFLRTGRFSRYFTAHFVLPLVAAVWSRPSGTALRYPARYLFAFLANHGMLSVSGSPRGGP